LMGFFERGALPKEIEDVVFSLRIGVVSPVIETNHTFNIFRVTRKKKPRLLSLEVIQAEIRSKLLSLKMNEAFTQYLEQLRTTLQVEMNTENLSFSYIKQETGDNQNV